MLISVQQTWLTLNEISISNKSMITNTEVRLCRRNVLIRRKLQFVHLYIPQQSFLHAKKRDKNARVIWSYME